MKAKPGDILRCISPDYTGWNIEVLSNDSYMELATRKIIKAPYIKFDVREMDDTVWRLDEATMVDRILTKYQDDL